SHRTAAATVARMNTLRSQLSAAQQRADSLQLSADERRRLADLKSRLDTVGPALGIGIAPQGGGGGAGGGNLYSRFTGLKASVVGAWETPSAAVQQQLRAAQQALAPSLRDAERLLDDAVRVGRSLQGRGVTLAP
ncbi:MAG TPA: hypothetical protein PK788_04725, partial [Gemmatimonadaceae bacterium]|nr:hypothetical protein [Gemmatimonadaceae bacterium]